MDILYVAIATIAIFFYLLNIMKMFQTHNTAQQLLRILGVFIYPLGVIMGMVAVA